MLYAHSRRPFRGVAEIATIQRIMSISDWEIDLQAASMKLDILKQDLPDERASGSLSERNSIGVARTRELGTEAAPKLEVTEKRHASSGGLRLRCVYRYFKFKIA
jgi:hypothetical protein